MVGHDQQYFRVGVGAVILDDAGQVLAFERADIPGAWQLPQGGLHENEEPDRAVLREVEEETGIDSDALQALGRYPEPLAYELPRAARSEKTGRGQVQFWFYFRFTGDAGEISPPTNGEFRDWRWMTWEGLISGVIEFRRPVYERLRGYLDREAV